MNLNAYNAVRHEPNGQGVGNRERTWLRLTGPDRQSFLNGQISNDVLFLQPGRGVHACMLNNTGHMLANLYVYAREDALWIEVTRSRAEVVKSTLERFKVREKVVIEDRTESLESLTIQGQGARAAVNTVLAEPVPEEAMMPLSHTVVEFSDGFRGGLIQHPHTPSRTGFDLVVPAGKGEQVLNALLAVPGAEPLDWDTLQVLRIEAGIPKWGADLDETVIPLEANMYSAINQNKGCYMGQEVIARIISRGHTNRSLVGFRLSAIAPAGATLQAEQGAHRNQEPGRITSVAESPEIGPIAMGYIRNEYAQLGAKLHTADGKIEATVATLPFVA